MVDPPENIPSTPSTINEGRHEIVVYSNVCGVAFTAEEAVLYFAQKSFEESDEAEGVVKVYTSLPHIKRLVGLLIQSLAEHEEKFGSINMRPRERPHQSRKRVSDLNEIQDFDPTSEAGEDVE